MATPNINLSTLDFEELRTNIKTYLEGQARFQDYDFEGSNMAVLLDVLAYNTYINAFYLNMVGNEMFLDTATLRDSVISHAKELNYLPRSFRSAEAKVDLTITSNNATKISLTMPKGTSFTSRLGSNNFTFTTAENITLSGSGGVLTGNNISIYEGIFISEAFGVDYDQPLRYVLSNKNIDTRSITVTVHEDLGFSIYNYTEATSLFGLNELSRVYFLQPSFDYGYEILFGDGVIGRRPKNGSVVEVTYRVSSGELPNGLRKFVNDGPIDGESNVAITTAQKAQGGSVAESLQSIKFNAPRYYATQERAITTEDYETLLSIEFPEINAVSAYGGELADPPQYGRVFVAVDINSADGLPASRKAAYEAFLKNRAPLSIEPIIVEPEYLYLNITGTVKYSIEQTSLGTRDIQLLALSKVTDYNDEQLNDFRSALYYSQLVAAINSAHPSIVSNDVDILGMKRLVPRLNSTINTDVNFEFPLYNKLSLVPSVHPSEDEHVITSTSFTFENQPAVLEDDGDGKMRVVVTSSGQHAAAKVVGTVDYDTGVVRLSNFSVQDFQGDAIRIYARPRSRDILSSSKTIMSIPQNEISLTIEQIK